MLDLVLGDGERVAAGRGRPGHLAPELLAQACVRRVGEQQVSRRPDDLDRLGRRVEDGAVQAGQVRELAASAGELDEHGHLRAQHVRVVGLQQVVDPACLVAAHDLALMGALRGEEDDRRLAGALARTDQVGELEAVDPRHLHVEQDHREVPVEQQPERIVPVRGARQPMAERRKRRLEGEEVLGPVVDEEDRRGPRRLVIVHWHLAGSVP